MKRVNRILLAMATVGAIGLTPGIANADTPGATPDGACTGQAGPFVEVNTNYGQIFHDVSQHWKDYNGTTGNVTDSFTNTTTGTVTSTLGTTLSVSFSDIISSVKADIDISVAQTETVTTGHTITYTIPAKQYGNAEYGTWQEHVLLEQYNQNDACTVINAVYSDSDLDSGVGWYLWTTKS